MNNSFNQVRSLDSLPAKYEERECTDFICIIIGGLLSLGLFITAIFYYNGDTYYKSNFPTDSSGILCGVDSPTFPYVYFVSLPNFSRRVCVSQCPTKTDTKLKCLATQTIGCRFSTKSNFEVAYYDNQPVINQNGNFCMPTDQSVKNKLLDDSKLRQRETLISSLSTILICMFIALGLSIILLVMIQYFTFYTIPVAVVGGFTLMVIFCICIIFYSTLWIKAKWLIFTFFLLFTILIGLTIWQNRQGLRIFCLLMRQSTKLLSDRFYVIGYVPLFTAINALFFYILVLQFKSFWAGGKLQFDPSESLYYEIKGSGPSALTFFWVIQAIWGATFIKQSFNFCVSGVAIQWFYKKQADFFQPFMLIVTKHFGSIVGGSFVTGFFIVGDIIFDLIYPRDEDDSSCANTVRTLFSPCFKFFDLVRSDSIAYVNLCGTPFCNSSRYCEYLCENSLTTDYSQSTSRSYRICAHLLIAGLVSLLGLYIKGSTSLSIILVIFGLSIFISTFFITLHADAAEAIQIITLKDEQFCKRQQEFNKNNKFNRQDLDSYRLNNNNRLGDEIRKIRLEEKEEENNQQNKNYYSWLICNPQ